MSTTKKKPCHNQAGKKTPQVTFISEGFAKPDDPVYKEGWHVHLGPLGEHQRAYETYPPGSY